MNQQFEYFICFRGNNEKGGMIGKIVYESISKCTSKLCYFSPEVSKNAENYRIDEKNALLTCKYIIYIITPDFFKGLENEDDEVRYELKLSYDNEKIKKIPIVTYNDFSWNSIDSKLISSIIGEANFEELRHLKYINITGMNDYKNTEESILEVLSLSSSKNIENKNEILKILRRKVEAYKNLSDAYLKGTFSKNLLPSIGNINRTFMNSNCETTQTLKNILISDKDKNFLVIGDGGIGKTVLMLEECLSLLNEGVPAIYFPMHQITQDYQTCEDVLFDDEVLKGLFLYKNYVVVFLDGFNEVAEKYKNVALKMIADLAKIEGVQILMTSRFNPNQFDLSFNGFQELSLSPLSRDQIVTYLDACQIAVPQDEELFTTLSYPLMLTLYTNAEAYKNRNQMSSILLWKENPVTNGEIIWNFFQTQLHKSVSNAKTQKQILQYIYILEFILPDIGFYMVENEIFEIKKDNLCAFLDKQIENYQKWWNILPVRIKNVRDDIDCEIDTQWICDSKQILKILGKELNILVTSRNVYYKFYHQNFRDCLAAIHLINGIKNDNQTKDWENWLEPHILKFVSELLLEEDFKTLVDKCRNKEYSPEQLIVSNIIYVYSLWKKNDFTDFDFKRLDLSNISLRKYIIDNCEFDGCKISPTTFLQRGHTDTIEDIILLNDRNQFISASIDGTIMIWSIATASYVTRLVGHQSGVFALGLKGNKILYSCSKDGEVCVWDLLNFKLIKQQKLNLKINKMCVTNKELILLHENSLSFYDHDLNLLKELNDVICFEYDDVSDKMFIVDNNKHIYGINKNEKIGILTIEDRISCMKYFDEKNILFLGMFNGKIDYITLNNNIIHNIGNHSGKINDIALIDNKYVATASDDSNIMVWDFANKRSNATLGDHHKGVKTIVYVPAKKLLISGSIDNSIRIWDVKDTYRELRVIEGYTNWINCIAKSKKNDKFITVSGDKSLRVWNYTKKSQIKTFRTHNDWVYSCDVSENGEICASGSCDGVLQVRNLSTGVMLYQESIHTGDIKTVRITKDGKKVATCGSDGFLYIIDINEKKKIFEHSFKNKIYKIVEFDDMKFIVVACADSSIHLVDVINNKVLWSKDNVINEGVRSLAITSDNQIVVCGGNEKKLKEFDIKTGQLYREFHLKYNTRTVDYSKNNNLIAFGDLYGNVGVLNRNKQKTIYFEAHKGEVRCVKFIGDDVLISGGSDSYIALINLKTKKITKIKPVELIDINGCTFKNITVTDNYLLKIIQENSRSFQ